MRAAKLRKVLTLAVTPGDPAGIGPEIVWKTLRAETYGKKPVRLLCFGAREPFEKLGAPIIETTDVDEYPADQKHPFVWLMRAPRIPAKKGLLLAGYQAGWAIQEATKLVLSGKANALVTGPISKERLQKGGFPYAGHTEFLADLCGVGEVTMMLANSQLRITLATTHVALKNVSKILTREKVSRAVRHTATHLRDWWGIRRPRIAVAALNPHGGEAGIFGDEEIRVISPALRALRKSLGSWCHIEGPLPADTLFANHLMATPRERYDAVVCMYHDQGLIPVKLLDFPRTVNVTLGLPIIRTSVDHGVAFDIAGKNKADPSSFQAALDLAIRLAKRTIDHGPIHAEGGAGH